MHTHSHIYIQILHHRYIHIKQYGMNASSLFLSNHFFSLFFFPVGCASVSYIRPPIVYWDPTLSMCVWFFFLIVCLMCVWREMCMHVALWVCLYNVYVAKFLCFREDVLTMYLLITKYVDYVWESTCVYMCMCLHVWFLCIICLNFLAYLCAFFVCQLWPAHQILILRTPPHPHRVPSHSLLSLWCWWLRLLLLFALLCFKAVTNASSMKGFASWFFIKAIVYWTEKSYYSFFPACLMESCLVRKKILISI